MDFLRIIMQPKATDLVNLFDTISMSMGLTKVFSRYNPNNDIRLRNIPPLYSPSICNIYQTTLDNEHQTNDQTKGWNYRFSKLVGHNYLSFWKLIKKNKYD